MPSAGIVRCGLRIELRRRMLGGDCSRSHRRVFRADVRLAGDPLRHCRHRRHFTYAPMRKRANVALVRDRVLLGRCRWNRRIALLRAAGGARGRRLDDGGTGSVRSGGVCPRTCGAACSACGRVVGARRRVVATAMAGRGDRDGCGRSSDCIRRVLRGPGVTSHPARRVALAAAAVAVSGILLRGQVADALVVRGDEFLYRSNSKAALRYYRRALRFDANNTVALDRVLFVSTLLRNRTQMRDAVERSTGYLDRRPDDDAIRMDRAMACRALGDASTAAADFAVAGYRTRDARALALAGFASRTVADERAAVRLFRAALVLAPKMPAALHALADDGTGRDPRYTGDGRGGAANLRSDRTKSQSRVRGRVFEPVRGGHRSRSDRDGILGVARSTRRSIDR